MEHTALGIIRKKPELYYLPLKRAPRWKREKSANLMIRDKGMELIMDWMPDIKEIILKDGREIPWYEGKDVH